MIAKWKNKKLAMRAIIQGSHTIKNMTPHRESNERQKKKKHIGIIKKKK